MNLTTAIIKILNTKLLPLWNNCQSRIWERKQQYWVIIFIRKNEIVLDALDDMD